MKLVRIYVISVILLTGGYIWCAINGYRVLGDDNEAGNTRVRAGRGAHYFYHK